MIQKTLKPENDNTCPYMTIHDHIYVTILPYRNIHDHTIHDETGPHINLENHIELTVTTFLPPSVKFHFIELLT